MGRGKIIEMIVVGVSAIAINEIGKTVYDKIKTGLNTRRAGVEIDGQFYRGTVEGA